MRGQRVRLYSGEAVTVLDISDDRVYIRDQKNNVRWIKVTEIKELL